MTRHGHESNSGRTPTEPSEGDILITRFDEDRIAVSVFPDPAAIVYRSDGLATDRAVISATSRRVDVWYTEDRSTYALKHHLREPAPGRSHVATT